MDDMTTGTTYDDWIGRKAYDRNRDKIGKIEEIFYDDTTGRPEWVTISTGFFGTSNSFAPIMGSQRHEDGLMLDVTKDAVKDAPNIDAEGHLEEAEEQRLYRHYAIDYTAGEEGYRHADRMTAGYDTSRRADEGWSSTGQESMLGDDERLTTRDRDEDVSRARLRRYSPTHRDIDLVEDDAGMPGDRRQP